MSTAPALYNHCVDVYKAMENDAKTDDAGNQTWEGSLTGLMRALGLSNPYYSNITKAMKAMDCMRQLRRGGGGTGSVWLLLQAPTEELYRQTGHKAASEAPAKQRQQDQAMKDLQHQLNELSRRVEVLEAFK
jgi:hypothetical protein